MARKFCVWGTKDLNTSAQIMLAKRLGFFRQEGLDMHCRVFAFEHELLNAFSASPEPPLIWTQTLPSILQLRARGAAVRIIAPLAEISTSYQVILREESDIVLPADLEGRTLGIMRGSLSEVALRNMAKDFRIDPEAITLIDAPPLKQLELFASGEIDGIACWEPWTSQARYIGGSLYFSGSFSCIPGHEGPVNWLTGQSLLVTSEDALVSSPNQLLACLHALKKATAYLNNTVHKAALHLSKLLDIEQNEISTLMQHNRYTMTMDHDFRLGLASVWDVSSTPLKITEIYTPELLRRVDADFVPDACSGALSLRNKTQSAEIVAEGNMYYPEQASIWSSGRAPQRYLLVDDSRVIIDVFSTIVEMLGGKVVGTAGSGAEGLGLYVDTLPDVVVMDISMPDMNGLDAMQRIFRINPQANILVLSGNTHEVVRHQAFELGAKLFIGKPFHVEHILQVLQKMMRKGSS